MIEASGISKVYQVHKKEPGFRGSVRALFVREHQEKVALRDVSLKVAAGEIVGLLGANGAGKTTLVKILSGIIQPSAGQATVLGYNPSLRPNELRKQMSLIMGQKAQLWWDLPAADAFLLLREIYQISKNDFDERVKTLASALEVEGQLRVPIRRLSLGERMKMELMAALLHRPKVIYLDEPTIGLDLSAQKAMRAFLKTYLREEGPAMILTSHYMEDIEDLCRRIAVVREGRIVYDGNIDALSGAATRTKRLRFTLLGFDGEHAQDRNQLAQFAAKWSVKAKPDAVAIENQATCSIDVERDKLPACVAELFQSFRIDDLLVQEEDIAQLIEQVQRGNR